MLNKIIMIFLPKQSPQRKLVKKILVIAKIKNPHTAGYYNLWMGQQRLQPPLHVTDPEVEIKKPLISVVVPVYNPSEHHFAELVYSIMSQAYENWELILSDGSTDEAIKKMVLKYSERDVRIKLFSNETKGISNNTNYGLEHVTGEYVTFCDNDDVLDPFALYEAARVIVHEHAELIYSDEDKISDDSEVYFDPHYKPDWSPDLLTHVNYINHLTVVKKSLLDKVGYLNPDKDGAQDYDLMLRLTDETQKISHIPKVLYHWRSTEGSTAQDFSSKKNITNAGVSAISEHFVREDTPVAVTSQDDRPGFYNLSFDAFEKVSIIIEPFASDAVLALFTKVLLAKTQSKIEHVEFILPFSAPIDSDKKNVTFIQLDADTEFISKATDIAKGDVIVSFNQPYLPHSKAWLEQLTAVLRQKHVQAVSPVVIQDDGTIQDCGLVYDGYGSLTRLFKGQVATNNQTFFGNTGWVRDVDGLTGGVVATRRKELRAFKQGKGVEKVLESFSSNRANEKFNVIYTPVVFGNNSIELAPNSHRDGVHFNNNLILSGGGYSLYAPESTAINILTRIAEGEGLSI